MITVMLAGCANSSYNKTSIEEDDESESQVSQQMYLGNGNYNGHDYVELGLPSGTLWATCNVGADKPENYGNYYAWGETTTKSIYDWATYKYAKGDCNWLSKYSNDLELGHNGVNDRLSVLQVEDDAATANWGSGWVTPTDEQWKELEDFTTHMWTKRDGVLGCLFTAKNSRELFLPAAGTRLNSEINEVSSNGYYWSRSLNAGNTHYAWCFRFYYSNGCYRCSYYRCQGLSVRPVREN